MNMLCVDIELSELRATGAMHHSKTMISTTLILKES
jgi:hypothetical protein